MAAGAGSVVIVTSRDKQALETIDCLIVEMPFLKDKQPMQLFKRYAPVRPNGLKSEMLLQIIKKCGGLPLSLKVTSTRLSLSLSRRTAMNSILHCKAASSCSGIMCSIIMESFEE